MSHNLKKIAVTIGCAIVLFIIANNAYHVRKMNDDKYALAKSYIEQERYNEAIKLMNDLGEYKDAKTIKDEIIVIAEKEKIYKDGLTYMNAGNYNDAIKEFEKNLDYKDSSEKVKEANYNIAIQYYDKKKYTKAKEYFVKSEGYGKSKFYLSKIEILTAEQSKQILYEEAKRLYDVGEYNNALELFEMIPDYRESKKYIEESKIYIRRMNNENILAAGINASMAIKNDNTVVAIGSNKEGQCNVEDMRDVVLIDTYDVFTIALKKDGKVKVAGANGYDKVDTSKWNDIIDVAAGQQFVLGLKEDGTVLAEGHDGNNQLNVGDWENIVAIDAGWSFSVGLTGEGELHFAGLDKGQEEEYKKEINEWKDVVNIAASGGHYGENPRGDGFTVGLRKDGTVVAVGNNEYGQCDVDDKKIWKDIIKVVAGDWYTVGLKKDGSIVITGDNKPRTEYIDEDVIDQCTGIVDIAAGYGQTLCLKEDGTVIAFGFNDYNKRDGTMKWTNIMHP